MNSSKKYGVFLLVVLGIAALIILLYINTETKIYISDIYIDGFPVEKGNE